MEVSGQLHSVGDFISMVFIYMMMGLYQKRLWRGIYEGHTESHEQLFFACELGTADEGECGGRWNQLLCYP